MLFSVHSPTVGEQEEEEEEERLEGWLTGMLNDGWLDGHPSSSSSSSSQVVVLLVTLV